MRRFFAILTTLLLLIGMIPMQVFAGTDDGMSGDGTESNPYIITTLEQLNAVRNDLDAHYVLKADIDASETAGWNNGAGFIPIGGDGNDKSQFTGVFDGEGHVISDLTINRPSTDYIGLFGIIGSDGLVRNVGLTGGSITGNMYTGGLAGRNFGTVDQSYVTGAVRSGSGIVGGMVGYNGIGSTVTDSYAAGAVSGPTYVGGLVGRSDGTVNASYATGAVSGSGNIVGGLVGDNEGGTISQSYATGVVSGKGEIVGGLVGFNFYALVSQSYATGAVSGRSAVGGLVGSTDAGTISQSYATGIVSGTSSVGGVVGSTNNVKMSSSFWDGEATGQSSACGYVTYGDCTATGLTTAQMKQQAAFPSGWDFGGIWAITEGKTYPTLRGIDANLGMDAATPTIVSAKIEEQHPDHVIVTFDEEVSISDASGVTITVDLSNLAITGISGTGTKAVSFTFNEKVTSGQGITLSYDKSSGTIADLANNPLRSFTGLVVENNVAPGFTVHFDSNGGSAVSPVIVKNGSKIAEPAAPTKEGYVFGGWFKDSDWHIPWNFETDAVTSNVTLYAKWTKKSSHADLRSLTLSNGALDPAFSASTMHYTASVEHNISSITVTAESEDSSAKITARMSNSTGSVVRELTNGTESPSLPLDVGPNTLTVEVTAPDDATTQTYTVTVTRERDNRPPPPAPPPYYPVTDIGLDENDLTFTTGDEPVRLKATIRPSYATNQQVTWSSSDPDIASVDQDGTVTPKAPGTAVITVTAADGNKTASCSVTVEAKMKPFILETSEKEILVRPIRTVSFKVFAVYPDGKRKEITSSKDTEYSSSSSLLTVKPGRVKAGKKEGEATVTITYQGEAQRIAVIVTKASVASLSVDPNQSALKKGETKQLELTAKLTDKQTNEVTERAVWTSGNEKVAKVSPTGEVTAVGVGSTSIQAIYGGKRLNVRVTVARTEPELKRLTASGRVVRIKEGDREQVNLTAFYEDGSKKDVTADAQWTSAANKIAKVSNGMITGIEAGKTTMTAYYQNRKITVTVYVQPVESVR
ncbi:MAG: hypothetical protein K0R47_591 [Brevibacillus sp.]|nr:hypothetical protein [Brevibacillus sp.]